MTELMKKNIYQKLKEARVLLNNANLKKTGMNGHTKVAYFEIGDFLPQINKIANDLNFMTQFHIELAKEDQKEFAQLLIIDTDEPESRIEFSSATAEVSLQGGQGIQNLGGKHTYMRRYLFIEAFEISENDVVDAQQPKEAAESLDAITREQIMSAQTHDDLISICKELKEKFPKQRDQIVAEFTKRRNEINQQNAMKEKGELPSENI